MTADSKKSCREKVVFQMKTTAVCLGDFFVLRTRFPRVSCALPVFGHGPPPTILQSASFLLVFAQNRCLASSSHDCFW